MLRGLKPRGGLHLCRISSKTIAVDGVISAKKCSGISSCGLAVASQGGARFFFFFGAAGRLESSLLGLSAFAAVRCLSQNADFLSGGSAVASLLTPLADDREEAAREPGYVNIATLVAAMSLLSKACDLVQGQALHAMVVKWSLDSHTPVCNGLVNLYAKCGEFTSAESVFERVELKDVVTWNSLISGCLCNGLEDRAAFYFKEMSISSARPDQVTFSCLLSACSYPRGLHALGESVHGRVISLSYDSHSSVANSLVSFYCKCCDVEAAEKVFRGRALKSVVSWNSMINGLVQNGRLDEAFDLLHEMQSTTPIQPDSVTAIASLQLCAEFSLLSEGMSVHGFTVRRGFEALNLCVTNSLIAMYIKCKYLRSAEILFSTMPRRDIISWNTMISGYSHIRCLKKESWSMFRDLLRTGLRCSIGTFLGVAPSFSSPEDLFFGKSVHGWMLRCGFPETVSAVNALMLMYINCGDLPSSSSLFEGGLTQSDVVSWNSVIVGCVQNEHYRDALGTFLMMLQQSHPKPDPITLVSVFSACGLLELLCFGRCLHGFTLKLPVGYHLRVRNALITMYSRCGDIESSESAFQDSKVRNLCSWNCMISGYVQSRESKKALEVFLNMGDERPDAITVVGLLCACAHLGPLRLGRDIHGYALRHGLNSNGYVSAALIDMYSKCGWLEAAIRVFQNSDEKSVAYWNSMILAYGFHGHGREAIRLFSEMRGTGIAPNKSTFISVLSACSHSGLVDEGWEHFKLMPEYRIEPATEHCVCMVDMLGRAGRLSEAYEFIRHVPRRPESGIWGALLSACKDHANLEMGKLIAEYLFHCEPENVGYYVSLSNLYAASEKWSDAINVRSLIEDRGLVKPPGCSLIDVCAR
ncbi:unnamed protein product [Spirodela intermedia]|uniref:Uncharacterized protein n=1 Tax=Spirodela intermedia TaxID=51605 RepID=A0A7I8KD60_SPIIN|nr:unnamed protein product [Spirodela intermedia]